jgi:Zn-dependent peptidase ImmA (M78 family)
MASNDYPSAVRAGALAAGRLLAELQIREQVEARGSSIDVFGAFAAVDLPVLIRPLKNLLGAYLSEPDHGVLVTSERPMSIQRWTAAHELGHYILRHKPSLDDENVLRRMPQPADAIGGDFQEDEANSFAVAFLMPRWLVVYHLQRQGWSVDDLRQPAIVYQLSLRLGTSYEAMCWTLSRYNWIAPHDSQELMRTKPKQLKQELLGSHELDDYRCDVWLLTKKDAGAAIDGSRNDLFVLRLAEHAGSGYLWNLNRLRESGFAVVKNETEVADPDEESVGSPVFRRVTANSPEAHRGRMSIEEQRPWEPDQALHKISMEYDFTGPEEKGLTRAERRVRLESA